MVKRALLLRKSLLLRGSLCLCLWSLSALVLADWYWQDALLTRDQQGQYYFQTQQFAKAARRFDNPEWKALAYYAAENFAAAAKIWTRLPGEQALFNRGNALAHMEDYAAAADSYRLALVLRPDWQAAQKNLQLITVLAAKPKEADEYFSQTEGELQADDFTFEKGGKRFEQAPEQDMSAAEQVSNKEIQALWMQRLQSTPADFLRFKFRYQYEMEVDD